MLKTEQFNSIASAKTAAENILLHNSTGPFLNLPRAAGWGYPEPYSRDLLFSILGIASTNNKKLIAGIKRVLETLAINQTIHGHIPSMVHDPDNLGASDTTPLFLIAVGIYRKVTNDPCFLEKETNRSLAWMTHQSPMDKVLVAQQPTSDWRDEQWVWGYGLYVNSLYHCSLKLFEKHARADQLAHEINKTMILNEPYYSIWTYKMYHGKGFDLLGNSLAIISGIASTDKAKEIILWIEQSCDVMRSSGILAVDLPPNFFPFIHPNDDEWRPRYTQYNRPGDYHNGGIWPFICGIYIVALIKIGAFDLAEKKLMNLTSIVRTSANDKLEYGFNEWIKSQDGLPGGQDWQTWSAALYLYAAMCVEKREVLYLS